MKEVYNHLTEIIPDFPMAHLMYLGDEDEEFIDFFKKYANQKGYQFDVKLFSNISDKYEKIDINSPRYHTNAYKYDTIFLNFETLLKDSLTHIFERVYAGLKNAGGLIVFLPIEDDFSFEIEYFLEDINFVAINPIDLSDKKKIVYAKKMHGWGGAR